MDNFRFHMYTDVVFGKGAEEQLGKKIREYGGTKVMIVYGKGSIKRSGLYDKVLKILNDEKIPYIEFGGIKPNPLLSIALEGIEIAKKEGVDFLLGVGGGSAMDTAKGIALGLTNEGDLWDYYMGKPIPNKMTPVGTIPTIAATGSETSRSTVLVKDDTLFKKGIMDDVCRPTFSLMNPEWTYTLPKYQTAAGAADIFAHIVERYFHPSNCYISDKICEGLMRSLIKYTPIALEDSTNYQARAEIMLAGTLGHNDFAGLGRGNLAMERGCHRLEAQFSGTFDTTHGAGLAVVMPAWMEYTAKRADMTQHIKFATQVFDVEIDYHSPERVVEEGVRRFREWLKRIGMPITLHELGISETDLKQVIAKMPNEPVGTLVKLTAEDVKNIYYSVL